MKKVVVIGMGYVGFPLACAIAKSAKYEVWGLDTNKEKINMINNQQSPISDDVAEKDIQTVSLRATDDENVLNNATYVLIAVPTPIHEDKEPDLGPLLEVCHTIKKYIRTGMYIVVESTINPGICEEVLQPVLEESGLKAGTDFELGHCPERINPGDKKRNVYNIPRNIGAKTPQGTQDLADFYRNFLDAPINEMKDIKHTEATKIIENTFRDINIAYVNELAKSFDALGLDVVDVIQGASNKPFGFMAHYPGCGVGGHCIPVDPYYLIKKAKSAGFEHTFLINARKINNSMPVYLIEKLVLALNDIGKAVKGTKIALLGMSYKSNIGDMRESPSLEIKQKIEDLGGIVTAYDPFVTEYNEGNISDICQGNDVIICATAHDVFIDYINENLKTLKGKIIIDGRNCLNKDDILAHNIEYTGIGR